MLGDNHKNIAQINSQIISITLIAPRFVDNRQTNFLL